MWPVTCLKFHLFPAFSSERKVDEAVFGRVMEKVKLTLVDNPAAAIGGCVLAVAASAFYLRRCTKVRKAFASVAAAL